MSAATPGIKLGPEITDSQQLLLVVFITCGPCSAFAFVHNLQLCVVNTRSATSHGSTQRVHAFKNNQQSY